MIDKSPEIRGLLPGEIREMLVQKGDLPYRAGQVFRWVQEKAVPSWAEMTNIGEITRHILSGKTKLEPLALLHELVSRDGTRKYLWRLCDDNRIETVLLHHSGSFTRERNTVCLSTQVGCAMGCAFCATGRLGFKRNLSAGEITSQVLDLTWRRRQVQPGFKVQNLVYMGMGEPLLNLSAVLKSIRIFNIEAGQNIGMRRITVSTCGIVPQIYQLAAEGLDLVLAVSLHAPTNELRDKLMPVNTRYPLEELIPACRYYAEKTGRRLTFEYVLLKNINDTPEQGRKLAELLSGFRANVNLIPLNTMANGTYCRPEPERVKRFQVLLQQLGVQAVVREEKGSDIEAACGQLAGKER